MSDDYAACGREEWITDEIRGLLAQIRGQHARKKRSTVIRLAFARANEQPFAEVFRLDDVCSETIWYQKWRHVPEIAAAYEACYQRALSWADEQTARLEDHYRRQRRQSVARFAADAPGQLAEVMRDDEAGSNRIRAADTLMRWAEPETAAHLQPTAEAGDQVVNNILAGLTNEQLERILGGDGTGGADDGAAEGGGA